MSIGVSEDARPAARKELGPLPRFLRPFVDWVAGIRATVHTKLLAGFLLISLLLLSMGTLSIVVLGRLNRQVETLTALNHQASQARDMIYEVTAQSHYRAMALLQLGDPVWTPKIYAAKDAFIANLADIRTNGAQSELPLLDNLETANSRFAASSDSVTRLFEEGRIEEALKLHIEQEHQISHELEAYLNELITDSQGLVVTETETFASNRRFLTIAVASFSGASLLVAMTLGAILSWSLIRPVRRVDEALELIAEGHFDGHVEVPNRDEFGNLTKNLNRTTEQLSTLYADLHSLNANLQETVETKVAELERASRLKRYLSPGLADSILSGTQDVTLGSSRRKFLTTFFSDIRGFTAAAERMEPEELVNELNDYLSEMTEIVFKHGGTLDKYVGDAVMVFFGDPIPQDDHAERAVRMGLEMLERMRALEEHWFRRYDEVFKIGIGISTGWVTVGDIGSPARSDYTVLGNQVNLASRLADKADPDQILVTERTMVAVDHLVEGRLVDQISLKGVSRPIKIYEVLPREDGNGK
jgi:class 3 adenylate cyclase